MTPADQAPSRPIATLLTEELMREVRRLKVRTRRRVDNMLSGEYHSAFRGRGIEFAEVREYQPGDDVRTIDWNVTARAGSGERAFVKRFVEERQLTVMLVVDQSGSGQFGTVRTTKSRLAAEVAAVLALAATRNNDRVGLMVFSDRVDRFVPPSRGTGQAVRVMTELLVRSSHGRGTDLAGSLKFLGSVMKRRAIVFVLSDFLATGYDTALRTLAARHQVVAITVSDPAESRTANVGLVRIADAESGTVRTMDFSTPGVRAIQAEAVKREASLKATLAATGVDRIAVSTDRPFVRDLLRYFRVREHRR